MSITWDSDKAEHLARHGVTTEQADEALADVDAVVTNPDYASHSGISIRTVGYSASFGDLLVVITVPFEGAIYGATAFRADGRDRRDYEER